MGTALGALVRARLLRPGSDARVVNDGAGCGLRRCGCFDAYGSTHLALCPSVIALQKQERRRPQEQQRNRDQNDALLTQSHHCVRVVCGCRKPTRVPSWWGAGSPRPSILRPNATFPQLSKNRDQPAPPNSPPTGRRERSQTPSGAQVRSGVRRGRRRPGRNRPPDPRRWRLPRRIRDRARTGPWDGRPHRRRHRKRRARRGTGSSR